MAYQVKTTTSYGQRLNKAIKGIVGGFIAFIAGTILLFWNEGNFIKNKRAIQEAEGACVAVEDVSKIDASLNNLLVHASAFADTSDTLEDALFGVSATAIALKRKVEYFQWVENEKTTKKDKIGGGEETVTTYTYEKKWVSKPVNSGAFKDPEYQGRNKVLATVDDKDLRAENVTFGAYTLPAFFISSISGDKPVEPNLTPELMAQWGGQLGGENMIHTSANTVYFGATLGGAEIGDVRITLNKVMPADVSIIGKVVGSTFGRFTAKNGKTFARLEMGAVSMEEMFAAAHSENVILVWILRLVGILLVIGGLKGIFQIVETLFKVLPFLANIVGAGVGLICGVFGFAWSLLVISIGWLFYRPLIGIPLVVVAVAGIWWLKKKAAEKKAAQPAETPAV